MYWKQYLKKKHISSETWLWLTLKCLVCVKWVCARLAGLWPIAPGDQSLIHQPQTHTKTDPLMSVFLEKIETAYHWSARTDVWPMTLTQTQQKQHKPRYSLTYVEFAQNILLGFSFKIHSGTYMCMYEISSSTPIFWSIKDGSNWNQAFTPDHYPCECCPFFFPQCLPCLCHTQRLSLPFVLCTCPHIHRLWLPLRHLSLISAK